MTSVDNHSLSLFLNPIWKSLAKHLAGECEECERERLFSAFDFYTSEQDSVCRKCFLTSIALQPLIRLLFSYLQVSDNTTKKLLQDLLLRKCMLGAVKGIASFGVRNPQPTGAPITIVWNFTNRCNLNCLHCHQDSSPTASSQELSTSQAFKVIKNLSNAGVVILTFSGGEPLLRDDIYEVIEEATREGLFCTIATNGTLLTKKVAKKLPRQGSRG
ncbi:hypothetical protein AKJ45_03655 [candidate division MSBL1 archaeon SCGC-AAA261F19]|uniref:Radical SAM core domain-containing protein n=1 Tax=candidate division MSBL1 archaeon SCGC-AAA261F19 TaxID=1698275 RepID=A0A133V701_9EURY|nr:hypothetical protein AKJ45_03655 [candidate division MSBL1 archaeon SCGC-AAA261F19]